MTEKLFTPKQIIFGIIGIIVAAIFFIVEPPKGLSIEGMKCLGIFLMAIVWWMGDVFPDYITAFWLLTLLVVFKIVPLEMSFSAYSGGVIWIVIPALAIGVALSKSGLLQRIVLKILSKFKGTFNGQVKAFLLAGNIIGPLIPSATAKVAIAAPLARTYSDTMGFKPKSKGAAGLFSSMWMSFGVAGPFFLTGTTMCFTMIGLLPKESQGAWTWLHWFAAVWPWGVVLLIGSYFAIRLFYTPDDQIELPEGYIANQYKELGQMTRNEKIAAFVLAGCLVLWVTESIHGISAALVALLGMSVLLGTKVLDRQSFRSNIAWDTVVFIAANTGIAGVFKAVGITKWFSASYGVYVEPLFSNIVVLIVASVIIISILRFIFVSQTALMTVYVVAATPFALAAGIDPFIPGIIALVTVNVWNVFYHNVTFITTHAASGEMVEYKQLQKMSYVYMVLCIVGMLCCIPVWKMLGML